MSLVHQSVLDSQLEVVNKKMKQYEQEIFEKVDEKIDRIGLNFQRYKGETQVGF